MADILFDIEVTGIKELKDAAANFERLGKVSSKLAAQYKPLGAQTTRVIKEQKRLEASHRTLAKAVEAGRITRAQANRAYEEERRVSKERILTDQKLIAQQKRKAKAEAEARKETERLTRAYAPARAALESYRLKQKEIRKALKANVLAKNEARQALNLLEKEFREFTGGVATGGNQFAKFNTEVFRAEQKVKRFASVGLQQAGYQFGDFAVQVQSGTNVAVAFGQQASQLLGIFGATGAIAGAGVAIATAFVAPLIEGQDEAAGLKDSLENVTNALEQNQQKTSDLLGMTFTGPLEEARLRAVEVLQVFQRLNEIDVQQQVAKAFVGTKTAFGTVKEAGIFPELQAISDAATRKAEGGFLGAGQADTLKEQKAALEIAKEVEATILMLAQASKGPVEDLAGRLQESFLALEQSGFASDKLLKTFMELIQNAKALEKTTETLKEAEEAKNNRSEEEKEFLEKAIENRNKEIKEAEKLTEVEKLRNRIEKERLDTFRKAEAIINRVRQQRRKALEAEEAREQARIELENAKKIEKLEAARAKTIKERFNSIMKEIEANDQAVAREQERQQKVNTSASERLVLLKQQNRVLALQIKYGKDSEAALETQKKFTLLNLKNSLEKQGVDNDIVRALLAQQEALIDNKNILKDSVKVAKELKQALTPVEAQYLLEKGILPPQAAKDFEVVNEVEKEFLSNKRAAARKAAEEAAKAYAKTLEEQRRIAEALQKELEGPLVNAIGDVSNAFGDFISRGVQDFKGFVKDILASFQNMLSQMIAMAVRNRILISVGMAGPGTVAGTTAAFAGPMGAFLGTTGAVGTAGTGFLGGATAALTGGFGNFFNIGANAAAAGGGIGATIGAALPPLLAVVAVIGLLRKKTKVLDEGLRVTVDGFDALIETFQTTQTSRLFGLLKGKPKTAFEAASADVADPLSKAVGDIQNQVMKAAESLGLASEAFEDFTYQFQLSLQGLTEEQKIAALNEELMKLGDEFTSLTGVFSTMNELLAVAQQRYDLETRLLSLQGDASALLTRQHELELAATHELNKGLLQQIHAIEQAQLAASEAAQVASQAMSNVSSAMANVERIIQNKKNSITDTFNSLMESIEARIDAANDVVTLSQSILGMLRNVSDTRMAMTRQEAISYLTQFRGGGRISDERELGKALDAVAEPTEDLFGNFVDYQRDFLDTSLLIRDLEKNAAINLTTDEKILKSALEEAENARERYEEEVELLEEQLQNARDQIDVLNGIDKSVQTVEQAIAKLEIAVLAAVDANAAADAARKLANAAGGGGPAGANVQQANQAGQGVINQLGLAGNYARASDGAVFQKVNIQGANQLLDVAGSLGIQTSGLSGAEIQQAISNTGNLAVSMDNITRDMQFAKGGYFGGGVRLVGERGPELEMTGASRIMSNRDTRKMLQNPELLLAVKEMRQEISDLRSEQRQLGINNNKYTKRAYDLYRQWDTEGLPTERT